MPSLTKLIHEIHRRSLWQVILIYLVGSWIVLQVVQHLTTSLGLPEWSPTMAIVLLLVGFPMVVATAFVQERVKPQQTGDDDTSTTGGTEEKVHRHKIFTWRNTALGGLIPLLLLAVTVIGYLIMRNAPAPEPEPEPESVIKSIAVLPFRDMSPNKDQEYFGEGMAEEILNALAQVEGLRVAARTSSFRLRNEAISTIGEQLNVTTVLEGSVRKEGNSIRITAQLNNAADNFHLWSKTYERELKSVFAIQDEISQAIANALHVKLIGKAGAPLIKLSTTNIEAYDHYLQGLYLWNKRIVTDEQTTEYLKTAIKHFKEAIALDPNYALAYSGLASAILFSQNRPPENISVAERIAFRKDYITQSQEALENALTLDPNLAEAHALLGFMKRNSYDMRGAEKEFLLAIDSNPEYADTHHWYSMMLASMGRFDEALMGGNKALELDPISHTYNGALAMLLEIAGQDDAAIQQYEKTIMLYPERQAVQWYLNNIGVLHLKAERIDEAVDAFSRWSEQKAISIDEETLWLFCKNVIKYKRTGIPMSLPPKLEADPKIGVCFLEFNGLDYRNFIYSEKNKDPDYYLAHFYVKMGQKEKALESLEQAQKKAIIARHGFPPYYAFALLYAELNEK